MKHLKFEVASVFGLKILHLKEQTHFYRDFGIGSNFSFTSFDNFTLTADDVHASLQLESDHILHLPWRDRHSDPMNMFIVLSDTENTRDILNRLSAAVRDYNQYFQDPKPVGEKESMEIEVFE